MRHATGPKEKRDAEAEGFGNHRRSTRQLNRDPHSRRVRAHELRKEVTHGGADEADAQASAHAHHRSARPQVELITWPQSLVEDKGRHMCGPVSDSTSLPRQQTFEKKGELVRKTPSGDIDQ